MGASAKPLATRIREAWQRKSGSTTLAMNRAPFRLLAIVNRFDLRKSPRRFGEGASGELRFVFSPLDLDNGCQEYANPVLTDKQGEQLVILEGRGRHLERSGEARLDPGLDRLDAFRAGHS